MNSIEGKELVVDAVILWMQLLFPKHGLLPSVLEYVTAHVKSLHQ